MHTWDVIDELNFVMNAYLVLLMDGRVKNQGPYFLHFRLEVFHLFHLFYQDMRQLDYNVFIMLVV